MNEEKIKKIVKEEMEKLKESSLSRIWQHLQSDNSFGIISAYTLDNSKEENEKAHQQLKEDVRNVAYGFIEIVGGYTYMGEDEEEAVEEKSLFIPEIEYNDAKKLSKKYDQESFIYKDDDSFALFNTNTGKPELKFERDITMDKGVLKHAWSQLIKDKIKGRGRAFAFELKERYIPTRKDALMNLKEGKGLPKVKYIDINF